MTFRVRAGRGFANEGEEYTAPVVARKLNGYKVLTPDGNIAFLCYGDFDIIEISDNEKNMPIEW